MLQEYLTMKFSLWRQYGALNSGPVFEAFRQGAHALGYDCSDNDPTADIDVIWSVLFHGRMGGNQRIWEAAKARSKPVLVLEVGGIDRGTTWKVGLNGINRDANFGDTGNDSNRANMLGLKTRAWRTNGEHILICGQHDKSLQWYNMPRMSQWVMDTIETIQAHTDRPIIFRPHPRCRLDSIEHQYQNVYRDNPRQITGTYDDFNLSFNKCHAVINYSSNPGIHSILNGVPAFVGTSSLAYDVGNDIDFIHDIENPIMPDREQWLNDYAYTEWTLEEISQGIPLNRLTTRL